MKFELSNLLNLNVVKIKQLKDKKEVDRFIRRLIIDNNLTKDKSSIFLLNQLKSSKSFESSIQAVWNFLVSSSGAYVGKEITKKSWYKGTAISGLECHSH